MVVSSDEADWLGETELRSWYKSVDRDLNAYHWGFNVDDALRRVDADSFEYGFDARLNNYEGMQVVDIGGAQLLHHTDQGRRPANDFDYVIGHGGHPNADRSHHEGQCLEYVLALHGFMASEASGSYDPTNESINVFLNQHHPANMGEDADGEPVVRDRFRDYVRDELVLPDQTAEDREKQLLEWYEGNDLPIPKIDVFAGEQPMDTYPMGWIERYAEPITVDGQELRHMKTLSFPAIAARKVYRSTVDNNGSEDDAQKYDLGTIYHELDEHMTGQEVGAFLDEFNEAWVLLCAANPEDAADYGLDVAGHLPDDVWSEVRGAVMAEQLREFDVSLADYMEGNSFGWHYLKNPDNRVPVAEH